MEIEEYDFGYMVVNGKRYSSDLIILPNKIIVNWWRKEGHKLYLEDIAKYFFQGMDTILVGTGYYGYMKIQDDLKSYIQTRGLNLIEAKTGEAVKTFNNIQNKEKILAAFHLTC